MRFFDRVHVPPGTVLVVLAARGGGTKCATFAPCSRLTACEYRPDILDSPSEYFPTIESTKFLLIAPEKMRDSDSAALEDNIDICTHLTFGIVRALDNLHHTSQNYFYIPYNNSLPRLFTAFF